jgi:hypothetical protein
VLVRRLHAAQETLIGQRLASRAAKDTRDPKDKRAKASPATAG